MSQPRLIGELAVVALEAENLPKTPGGFRPFCVFKLGNNAKRTNAATDGGRNPNWDAQVNMPVPHGYNQMSVQVLHEDSRGNQIVCEGTVDLTKVLKDGECDDWYPLKQNGKEAGDIYLEMTFYSVNVPPKRQPTRLVHPRPPHMGGYQRPPPMPNQYPGRPHPPPMQHPGPPPLHMSSAPRPQAPPPPIQQQGPASLHMSPAPRPQAPPPPHGSFSGRPPPPQGPFGGGSAPPPPGGFHPVPPGPHHGPPSHGPGPIGMPMHTGPPPSMMSPGPAPPSVSLGSQWRSSSAPVKQPAFGPQGSYSTRPQQPLPPQNAPLLSSPYRPGPPPPQPYNNGAGFAPVNQPGKPSPNYPPEHYHPGNYGGPPPPPQQPMYPVRGGPPNGAYPPQGHPQGYPSQPGYPPY